MIYNHVQSLIGLGNKDKLIELQKVKDNLEIKEFYRLMLDKSICYNIKTKSLKVMNLVGTGCSGYPWEIIDFIKESIELDLRGQNLIDRYSRFWTMHYGEDHKVLEWILDRNCPAKVGVSTVNKVWPGLIYKQLYMGAVPATEAGLARLPWYMGIICEVKEDGMALLAMITDGNITLRTRQGQDITKYFPSTIESITDDFPNLFPSNGMVHFEMFVEPPDRIGVYDRKTGNGYINKQIKNGTIGGILDESIRLVVLDYTDFDAPKETCNFRIDLIENGYYSDGIRPVEYTIVYSEEEARKYALEVIRKGGEGVILKHPDGLFRKGKPWYNIKLKHEFEVELRVIGVNEHKKRVGEIGSLICVSEDRLLWVDVGSGLTDEDRLLSAEQWFDSIVTVRAESIIKSKTKAKPSLYLPRLIEVREDKTVADTYKQIQMQEDASKGLV